MAVYEDLFNLVNHKDLLHKISVAITVAAVNVLQEDVATAHHAQRYAWAAKALIDPIEEAKRFQPALIAMNKDVSAALILGAGDAAIQDNVNTAVNLFALSDAGLSN